MRFVDRTLFKATPAMHGISIVAFTQDLHVRVAVSQTPLVLFQSFLLTSYDVELMLFIGFLIYEAQYIIDLLSPRYVSVCNQVRYFFSPSLYLLIFSAYFSLQSRIVVLEMSNKILRFREIVVHQG